ncbi:helix-turn-helix domain-containing protein [Tardiphaga sp.]|uniref:helix-turn-helix domain-containing protein n=1 Tax=Tardiphaga sp. TaxID=1926292 RepID=UPI003529ED7E
MLLDSQPRSFDTFVGVLSDASSTTVAQLLLDARQAIGSDVGAALRCIEQAASLLEAPVQPSPVSPARGGLARWQTDRIKRHIDANLDEAIQVSDLARIARLSCGYFSNAFKTTFGQSPHAYIVSRRLTRAMELMKSSGKSLCEIAIDCGFSDQAHLCRQFRRATGASPNAWRRNNVMTSELAGQQ